MNDPFSYSYVPESLSSNLPPVLSFAYKPELIDTGYHKVLAQLEQQFAKLKMIGE